MHDIVYAESDDSPWEENEVDPLDDQNRIETSQERVRLAKVNRVTPIATQSRIKCVGCDEDLVSDVEEDELKNIGCDKCPRWFHMKCTMHKGRPYAEVADQEFICHVCF